MWQFIQNDKNLLELARTPFLLSIIALSFQEPSFQEWRKLNFTPERLEYLFDSYIQRMLDRQIESRYYPKGKEPKPEQTKRWLTLLAKQLQDVSQTEFFIEQMQPSWLQTKTHNHKWMYRVGVGLLSTLLFWLIIFSCLSIGGQSSKQIDWFLLSPAIFWLGPAIRLYGVLQEEIKPIETLKLSLTNVLSGLTVVMIPMLKYWAIILSCTVLISGLYFLITEPLTISGFIKLVQVIVAVGFLTSLLVMIAVVMLSLVNALGVGLGGTAKPEQERITITSNQGIWQSLRNVFPFALIGVLSFSVILIGIRWLLSLIFHLIGLRITPLTTWLVLALVLGLIVGLYPGLACIQHFSLRVVLRKLDYIPWDYARFLNYATTERMFLQRVGGRYQFIHPLLQEHFAQMKLDKFR